MNKRQAFTLVELLIVMGILAILMTIGIAVGRFAIQRANNIQHESAATQLGQAFQSYYTDNRRYPDNWGTNPVEGDLAQYIDGSFDGGSAATFYYGTNNTNQSYLVCVSYGGELDSDELGYYCHGDGYGDSQIFGGIIDRQKIDPNDTDYNTIKNLLNNIATTFRADWDGKAW